jgi:hypothetical protein
MISAVMLAPMSAGAPREWDLGSYDICASKADSDFMANRINITAYGRRMKQCCDQSGGVWKPHPDGVGGGCSAPSNSAAGTSPIGPRVPGPVLPPGAVQSLEPVP